jgi:predicted O-methyltransferase YrrM
MYSKSQLAWKYLRYYFSASNGKGHGTHSPFVFDFIKNVLRDHKNYDAYPAVEGARKKLLQDQNKLKVEDFGAGSASGNHVERTVSSIVSAAAKPRKYGQLLYRVAQHYKPANMLELGTSLGISTAYLALGNPKAKLVTAEGSKEIAERAKENLKTLKLNNVEQVRGEFKYTLPMALFKMPTVDLAFIDGNHRKEPTENYFQLMLEKKTDKSIFILDDIHWSEEMEQAWASIRNHKSVKCSIDLFSMGFIFFNKEFKEKQEFTIRY